MSRSLFDYQNEIQTRRPEYTFSRMFEDDIPFKNAERSEGVRPAEMEARVKMVATGKCRVFDSWIAQDMINMQEVIDMSAKGIWRLIVHQYFWPPAQRADKPPRLMVYMVWNEYHREISADPADPKRMSPVAPLPPLPPDLPLHQGPTP